MKFKKVEQVSHNIKITPISKLVNKNENFLPGINVISHCRITAYVADALFDLCTESQKKLLTDACKFYAGAHDVGKISPSFQKMIYQNLPDFVLENYPEICNANAELARRSETAFHGKVSQVVFESLLGMDSYLAKIEGMHHGFCPNSKVNTEAAYGGMEWTRLRHELIENIKKEFLPDESIPEIENWEQACAIGGFITVCDWIASGDEFAKLTQSDFDSIGTEKIKDMAKTAIRNAGFCKAKIIKNLSFKDIFGFNPRNAQEVFIDSINGPGVYVLEAPMGLGKTEAALYAAYKLIEDEKAHGIYFGLPTQLTSNKIYDRVKEFISSITGNTIDDVELKLLHSASWLEEKDFGVDGNCGKSWFDEKKRGILAPYAVGTADQALMAVLNVKHGMVRAYGLAGKVVILDEVHSYDSFTGTILNNLIDYLKKIGTTVIILSATLNNEQKRKILQLENTDTLKKGYPLVTCCSADVFIQNECEIPAGNNVKIAKCNNEQNLINRVIEKASNGEQVLWIENTVSEAQSIFKILAARCSSMDIECGLIHSRYMKNIRQQNEEEWTTIYGKNGDKFRKEKGHILVGTQVLEQSLDIDADFLVTRLCPSDMLLQRIGRLWRHSSHNAIRPKGCECEAVIITDSYQNALKSERCFGLSSYVYSEYILYRTLEEWEKRTFVKIPEDIREIIENTYSTRVENGKLQELLLQLKKEKEKLESFARIGLSTANHTMDEGIVKTRYAEKETVNVLLVKKLAHKEGRYYIKFQNEKNEILLNNKTETNSERKHIAKMIMGNCVSVNENNAPLYEDYISECFSRYVYTGEKEDSLHPFRVAFINDGYISDINGNVIEIKGKKFIYDDRLGYQVVKEKEGVDGK